MIICSVRDLNGRLQESESFGQLAFVVGKVCSGVHVDGYLLRRTWHYAFTRLFVETIRFVRIARGAK